MPRYLEQLNECTDPTSGDWLGIVDVSAGATDKDRKVDVGKFARLAAANTFTAAQTISYNTPALTLTSTGVGSPRITLTGGDFGTDRGCILSLGRNSNVDTPAAGFIYLMTRTGSSQRLWADNTGLLRIGGVDPVFANDTAGTVVGAQTSSLDAKTVLGDPVEGAAALACVEEGAAAVRRFVYKNGAFAGEEFSGLIVDYAPRYGMDRDADHPAGKSLNVVNAIGDLMLAMTHLAGRVAALEAA